MKLHCLKFQKMKKIRLQTNKGEKNFIKEKNKDEHKTR